MPPAAIEFLGPNTATRPAAVPFGGGHMKSAELLALLRRSESPTLDFKRQWYKNESTAPEGLERLRHEFVKDILSLANGNESVAAEDKHLVIGADDVLDAQGNRQTWHIADAITDLEIRNTVNPYCDPPIDDVRCEPVILDSKQLYVITLPASPHIHETTKRLKTPKAEYDPFTVFVRHSSGIEPASTKERVALLQLKRLRYTDLRNAPPAGMGAVAGASVGAMLLAMVAEEDPNNNLGPVKSGLYGGAVGALFGGFVGWQFNNGSVRTVWNQLPAYIRLFALLVITWAATFSGIGIKRLLERLSGLRR